MVAKERERSCHPRGGLLIRFLNKLICSFSYPWFAKRGEPRSTSSGVP